jgi:hypothetical protein
MAVQLTVRELVDAAVPDQIEIGAPEVVTVPKVALVAALLPETTVKKTKGATLNLPVVKVIVAEPVPVTVPDSITYGKYSKELVKLDALSTLPLVKVTLAVI